MGSVGARVRDDAHLLRREVPVCVDARPEGGRLRVPAPGGHELLLTGELEPHGAAGRHREVPDDVLDEHLLLRAEPAADPRLDDADPLHGEPEERRDHAPDVEWHLGRRDDLEPFVAVPPRDRDVGLQRRLLDLVHAVCLLDDAVRGREPSLDVPGPGLDVVDDVAARVERAFHVGLVVDHGGPIRDRDVLVEHRRERLPGHPDQVEGGPRDLLGVGRDGRHAVSDEPHLVVEADLVVRQRVRVALATRCVADARHVPVVDDGVDAGKRPRRGIVDRHDAGVRVRAVQHLGDQRAGQVPVVRERGVSLRQLQRVGLGLGVAHHAGGRHVGAGNHPGREGREIVAVVVHRCGFLEPVEMHDIDRRGLLPAQHRCGPQHGVHRPQVPGLPVEDPRERIPDVRFGRIRRPVDERPGREDHGRRGVAGLDGACVDEGLLDRVQLPRDRHALDRFDPVPFRLGSQHDVRRHEPAVDEHRGGAGLAGVRAVPHAVEAGPPQHRAQGFVRFARDRARCPVDGEGERHARSLPPRPTMALDTSTSARCAL